LGNLGSTFAGIMSEGLAEPKLVQGGIRPAFASLPPARFALWRDQSRRYGAAAFACIHERRLACQP
jgi:hypothetical protein